jgi:hypothetical protein
MTQGRIARFIFQMEGTAGESFSEKADTVNTHY